MRNKLYYPGDYPCDPFAYAYKATYYLADNIALFTVYHRTHSGFRDCARRLLRAHPDCYLISLLDVDKRVYIDYKRSDFL